MRLKFTKMHGAGNDFVVIDGVRQTVRLTTDQWRALADRHRGIGADQILLVEPPDGPDVDFVYRIFNADGGEVEQCGNGARCFARFVYEQGLTTQTSLRVRTQTRIVQPHLEPDGRVTVAMGLPIFDPAQVPFDTTGLNARAQGAATLWSLPLPEGVAELSVLSLGNPHAVLQVPDVRVAPVELIGAQIEAHPRFARRVNVGFVEIVSRTQARLRVFERGVGETLSCGTGACAAAVVGMRSGWLDAVVDIQTRGGRLTVACQGASVALTGPAQTVFSGEIDLQHGLMRDEDA